MRLLHFADLHLGVESYGYPDPGTGHNSRLLDFLKALDSVVDFALHGDIDLVLFCGDAYRRGHSVDPTEQKEFAMRMIRLATGGVPVFLVVGNHDIPKARGKASTVDIFTTLQVENVYVASRPGIHRVHTRRGELSIMALPWLSRGAMLGREDMRGLTMEEVDGQFRERLRNIIETCATEAAHSAGSGQAAPAILAAHIAVMEAKLGSEREFILGSDPAMPVADLARPPFSYVALGHYHRSQTIGRQSIPAVYAGSLQGVDFSDEGMDKGFYEVEIEEDALALRQAQGGARFTFHPLPSRPFLTLEMEMDSHAPPMEALRHLMESRRSQIEGAIVRTRISGADREMVPEREVVRILREDFGAYYALPPTLSTRARPTRLGATTSDQGLSPLEALKLYLEQKQTSPERLQELLDYGRRLVEEEEASPAG
ncbi:MAG: exonuclease SbcCD subunit D [Dehalococcoidia bacterium]|jgi:exonuclease SbcD|nr:exonuclease SbcCD subunit D [Dehalococcoidia bacterium]